MHVVATMLERPIIVYDDRERAEDEAQPGILFHYKPGCDDIAGPPSSTSRPKPRS